MKSFLKKFSGKTPLSHENEGDELFAADLWGKAKIEYERALQKLERTEEPDRDLKARLQKKIASTKEALARGHKRSADDMLDAGFYDDARELYLLALELTEDARLKADVAQKLEELDFQMSKNVEEPIVEYDDDEQQAGEEPSLALTGQSDEYFTALCGTLPADVQKAYHGYVENFKK